MSSSLTGRPDTAVDDRAAAVRTVGRETERDDATGGEPGRDVEAAAVPVAAQRRGSSAVRRILRDRRFWAAAPLLTAVIVMATAPGLFTRVDPAECHLARSLGAPQRGHPFGFDLLGCDYFTRTVYGARTSLVIAVTVVLLALAFAVLFGALAGMTDGAVDTIISRTTDVVFGIPVVLGGL